MLDKAGFKLGIGPIDQDHIEKVERHLQNKGLFKNNDTNIIKRQRTIKSLVKTWSIKNLKNDRRGLENNRHSRDKHDR